MMPKLKLIDDAEIKTVEFTSKLVLEFSHPLFVGEFYEFIYPQDSCEVYAYNLF